MMRQRRKAEGGFALLLVFAVAAGIAIFLYMELPRAVFESARTKQDILTERGEQFKIAIRRYYNKTRMFPKSIDDLENTNGVRFLRRKYVDPMTGKDEWRLIHGDGNGTPLDSKVIKPPNAAKTEEKSVNTLTGPSTQVGGAPATGVPQAGGVQDVAMRQRATDRLPNPNGQEVLPTDEPAPSNAESQQPPPPSPEAIAAGQVPGNPPASPGVNSQTANGNAQIPANAQAGATNTARMPPNGFPPAAGLIPGNLPGVTPAAPLGQTGITSAPAIGQAAAPVQPQAVGGQNPQQQTGAGMVQQMLTNPRQNVPSSTTGMAPATLPVGGIIGVASKYEGEGIKVVNERTRIEEWEFLFDVKTAGTGGQAAGQGMPGQGTPGGMPGMPGMGGFGNQNPGGNRPNPGNMQNPSIFRPGSGGFGGQRGMPGFGGQQTPNPRQ